MANSRTGEIYNPGVMASLLKDLKPGETLADKEIVEVTDDQYKMMEGMTSDERKKYMRNQPCPCGSKKRFKFCCE